MCVLRSTGVAVSFFTGLAATVSAGPTVALGAETVQSDTKVKKSKKMKVLETPDLGIKYIELIKGTGPFPAAGDFVIMSYTGMSASVV